MHGSRYLRQFVQDALEAETAIVSALKQGKKSIVGATTFPFPAPGLLHYPENLTYSGPINSDGKPSGETGTYVVRLVCEGWSDQPILAAADAMLEALSGVEGQITGIDGDYWMRLDPAREWPNTSYIEMVGGNAVAHRELGTIFSVEITRT